ncbi:MAG: biotin/lipoyl-containing protein [Thermodesulfobacteriota bacterium]
MREYNLTINDHNYLVKINRVSDEEVTAEVNGVRQVVTINDIKNLSTKKLSGPPAPATTPATPASTPAVSRPPAAPPGNGGSGIISSPIPGHILEIVVQVGDKVLAGQKLLVLEAMKMENIITAEKPGVIKKVMVRTGDAVTHGQAMIEIG